MKTDFAITRVSENRSKLYEVNSSNFRYTSIWVLCTIGFRKLLFDCISGFLNTLNQEELSYRTPQANSKKGLFSERFTEAVKNKKNL
jgi:hypothetical protein